VPTRTPNAHAATEPKGRAALLLILTAGALTAGLVAAAPAAAIDDPSRPDARVTHGPSCRPGGVVVEVRAGTLAYAVTLATTRAPGGEDAAEVAPGETVVLSTGDVAWGETIDGYLEYTPLEGAGGSHVDELAGYTFTRPAEEDCAAIIAPAAPATVPLAPPGGEAGERGGLDAAPPADRSTGSASPAAAEVGRQFATTVVAPAATVREGSLAPVLVAAVALVAASAGLVAVAGRRLLPARRPPRNA
jgi:hypothetical protein